MAQPAAMTDASLPSLGLLGAAGRMGRAIAEAAPALGARIAGGIDRGEEAALPALAARADTLIDFSTPDALPRHLDAAVAAGTPLLIGTTGLTPAHHALIDAAAARIAVLQTANTSLGVTVLRVLVGQAARMLGEDWDIEVVEMHHRHKVDAPSGTALLLGEAAALGRGAGDGRALDRGAHDGRRQPGGIYYASLRGGSVAGDHQVVLAGEGERIELGHRAESRAIFAHGAVRAARWLAAPGRASGRYAMADVLGL